MGFLNPLTTKSINLTILHNLRIKTNGSQIFKKNNRFSNLLTMLQRYLKKFENLMEFQMINT